MIIIDEISRNLIISTVLFYIFLKICYFVIQKIILVNTEKKILQDDEKICYIPKSASGALFMMALVFGIASSYYFLPFFLHKYYIITDVYNAKYEISQMYNYIIWMLLSIIAFIIFITFYCCKKIIITNKRIIISWIFENSKKVPIYKDILKEDIFSLEVIYYNQIIRIKRKNKSYILLRGLSISQNIVNEIQNCLKINN